MQAHREIGTDKGKQLMASSSTLTYVYRVSYQQHPSVCMCIPNHACVQDTFMWIPTKIGNFVRNEWLSIKRKYY